MQRDLRQMLENKVAEGQGYYFDQSGGELVAGRRRKPGRPKKAKKPARMVKGSKAAKDYMRKLRNMRGKALNDPGDRQMLSGLYDENDAQGPEGLYAGKYKNPLQRAEKEYEQLQKDNEWNIIEAPKEMSNLLKTKLMVDALRVKFNQEDKYKYDEALKKISDNLAMEDVARKYGYSYNPFRGNGIGGKYKNPLSREEKKYEEMEKDKDWNLMENPKVSYDLAKKQKKILDILKIKPKDAAGNEKQEEYGKIAEKYIDSYNKALEDLAANKAYEDVAKKYGYKFNPFNIKKI